MLATTFLGAVALSNCKDLVNFNPTSTPTPIDTFQLTRDCFEIHQSQTSIAATETAKFFTLTPTSTPMPTITMTPTPNSLPQTQYIVGNDEFDCVAIAWKSGILLEDLYNANPTIMSDNYNHCIINPGDIITIPSLKINTLEECVNNYNCNGKIKGSESDICLSGNDSGIDMLTHVIFGEGGSTLGNEAAANELYVLVNRVNQILESRNIDRYSLSDDEYTRLLVQIASSPYYDKAGNIYPAFNAFDSPVAHPENGEYGYENWNNDHNLVVEVISSRGNNWIFDSRQDNDILNDAIGKSVVAYCAPMPGSPEPNTLEDKVYFEARDYDPKTNQYQFYFSFYQFFYKGGKDYCETYANYE